MGITNGLTQEDINRYVGKYRKRGHRTIETLLDNKDFMKVIYTDYGKILFKDLIELDEYYLDRIASLTATDEEKGRYAGVRWLMLRWARKICEFNEKIEEIKQTN